MIYKFKCKATGDLIMLAPQGDALMRALGREPAAQGIIELAAMGQALEGIAAAVTEDEVELVRAEAASEANARGAGLPKRQGVTLRQRLWPMVEMLRRAQAAGEPIVWGV